MTTINGCTVTSEDGSVIFKRQRVAVEDGGRFTSVDRRTGRVRLDASNASCEKTGKIPWVLSYPEGILVIKKSGCGCGR
jgi:hypothetical protein